jgi:DNA-binding NtrC family response regulator
LGEVTQAFYGDFAFMDSPRSVLIVDDDRAVLRLFALVLQRAGFVVRTASSGREAVEVYRQDPTGIGLVLLDVRMPDQDGPHTLAALQAIHPGVRCCFMTGQSASHGDEDLCSTGAVAVLKKPVSLDDLTLTIRKLLAGE